jgi:hypothetical protein
MRALALVSLSMFGACDAQPQTYPPDYERNFMVACEAQRSTNALCSCVWERIEAEISPGDFAALERLPGPDREAHPLTAQINGYVEACNVTLTRPLTPGPEEPVPPP